VRESEKSAPEIEIRKVCLLGASTPTGCTRLNPAPPVREKGRFPMATKPTSTINKEIALHEEWTYELMGISKHFIPPGVTKEQAWYIDTSLYPPNYCNEWKLAGPLWIKMVSKVGFNEANDLILIQLYGLSDDALSEAIARAFHAAFVEGEE
jgi:hypothetical protein